MSVFGKLIVLPLPSMSFAVGRYSEALRRVEHDHTGQARDLVDLRRDRDAIDEVLELEVPTDLGDDRVRVRVPARDELARRNLVAVLRAKRRAVRHLVPLALTAELVDHR